MRFPSSVSRECTVVSSESVRRFSVSGVSECAVEIPTAKVYMYSTSLPTSRYNRLGSATGRCVPHQIFTLERRHFSAVRRAAGHVPASWAHLDLFLFHLPCRSAAAPRGVPPPGHAQSASSRGHAAAGRVE
jgi:hypothetical protein